MRSALWRRCRDERRGQPLATELVDEGVDHSRGVVFADEIIKATEQERRLSPILALDETARPKPSDVAMSGL